MTPRADRRAASHTSRWRRYAFRTVVTAVVPMLAACGGIAALGPGDAPTDAPTADVTHTDPPAALPAVDVIGDSITVRAQPVLQQLFPGAHIDGRNGRTWTEGKAILDGLHSRGLVAPILVFALGTNGPQISASDIAAVKAVAPHSRIVLVTARADDRWFIGPNNAALREAARHDPSIALADWDQVATVDLLDPPHIHPSLPIGNELWSGLVYAAVSRVALRP